MRNWIFIIIMATLISCKGKDEKSGSGNDDLKEVTTVPGEDQESREMKRHSVREWGVGFEYAEDLEIFTGELAPNAPVINIYPEKLSQDPPFGVHEDPALSYIAVLPNGFGVDAPAGRRIPLVEWEGAAPVHFNVDPGESVVYLLENGEPWAYSFRFQENPEKWNDYGSIFVHFGIRNFEAECEEREDGEKIAMEDCDPLAGNVIKYFGDVKETEAALLMQVLQSMYFFSESGEREETSDLIRVTHPAENEKITSPVKIKGEARGYWFFEGDAPMEIMNNSNMVLGRGAITAEGDWMTEEFVPFTATVDYDATGAEEGYIVFRRSNASGKPEHDRSYRLKVRF